MFIWIETDAQSVEWEFGETVGQGEYFWRKKGDDEWMPVLCGDRDPVSFVDEEENMGFLKADK